MMLIGCHRAAACGQDKQSDNNRERTDNKSVTVHETVSNKLHVYCALVD